MGHVLHLAPAQYFQAIPPDRPYLPIDYERDGFVHCIQHSPDAIIDVVGVRRDAQGTFTGYERELD
ncbi:MAG TPA: hypothetical protein VJ793_12300 [Anaerolineae bacterium]|nr:hypothetical protein [Anaerolineae bacterium]